MPHSNTLWNQEIRAISYFNSVRWVHDYQVWTSWVISGQLANPFLNWLLLGRLHIEDWEVPTRRLCLWHQQGSLSVHVRGQVTKQVTHGMLWDGGRLWPIYDPYSPIFAHIHPYLCTFIHICWYVDISGALQPSSGLVHIFMSAFIQIYIFMCSFSTERQVKQSELVI